MKTHQFYNPFKKSNKRRRKVKKKKVKSITTKEKKRAMKNMKQEHLGKEWKKEWRKTVKLD